MESFKLKVLTPVGVVLEKEQVVSANLPSSQGEIGILPGHVRYSGLLGNGILKYKTASGEVSNLTVHEGFCNFLGNELLILADKAELNN